MLRTCTVMKRSFFLLLTLVMAWCWSTAQTSENPSRVMNTPQTNGGHFAWGSDLSSSIDMTGNSMTSIDIGAYFGYRNCCFRIVGVGADIHMMMSNSSRCIPIYAIMQTSFSPRPQLCFLDLRGGVSMNNIENMKTQTGGYGSAGIGVTLAHSSKFAAHLILAYTFIQRKDFETPEGMYKVDNLQMATLRIGVCF